MSSKVLIAAAAFATVSVNAMAGGHSGENLAVAARQGQMQMMQFNVATLGNMARGNIEYDAAAAQTAADNLAALLAYDGRAHWPQGTDAESTEGSRALATIWEDMGSFGAAWGTYAEAVNVMQASAGGGLDALRGGIRTLGQSCNACHQDFRQSRN